MRFFAFITILLFLSSCAQIAPNRSSKSADKSRYYLQIGISEMIKGNYRSSLVHLREAKKLSPDDPVILNNLGLTYFGMKEYVLAEQEFLAALKIQPDFTEVKNNLGALYVTVGKYKQAQPLLIEATKDLTYNKPAQAWQNLGLAYFHLNKFDNSEKAFLKALEFNPRHCEATYYYARSLFEKKSFKLAAQSFDRAVDRCEKFDEPIFYSALAYIAIKDQTQAAGRLRELVSKHPKSTYAGRAKKLLEKL